jgi:drug/metabolite transporter (DMT)-like permease
MAATKLGNLLAACGMICVGSSVAVSQTLVDAPLFTVQAVRYTLAALLLLALCRVTGRPILRPRGREWLWLIGVAASGLVLFNIAVVHGDAHAEPAVIGIAVASVPLVLAIVGPLTTGSRPARAVVVAAVIVTVGAVLVQGAGRTDTIGLAWALVVLVTEAAFTLLAVPVLTRLGPWVLSLHTTWIAAIAFAVLGVTTEGPGTVFALPAKDFAVACYLAIVVTALAFVLWYTAVGRIGAGRAGLFTGIVPIVAAAGGLLLGGPMPHAVVWIGVVVVLAGLCVGMAKRGSERAQVNELASATQADRVAPDR